MDDAASNTSNIGILIDKLKYTIRFRSRDLKHYIKSKVTAFGLRLVRLCNPLRHSEEIELQMMAKGDEMNELMASNVRDLLCTLHSQGHSGFSVNIATSIFSRLVKGKPLGPLTGEEDEWADPYDPEDATVQNKRCSSIFKDLKTGVAYNISGRIFQEPCGSSYTNRDSRVYIDKFPYTVPKEPEVVELAYCTHHPGGKTDECRFK